MAQFLTGILPLKTETGRFKGIRDPSTDKLRCLNSQERICEMCAVGEPEDVIHVLCLCTLGLYLGSHYLVKQCKLMMTSNHILTLRNLFG